MKQIVALLTCHNRRRKTLSCLEAIHQQKLDSDVKLRVVLVDDSSTDGTASAVRRKYPDIIVIEGDGSLYWNGGMRLAFNRAQKLGPEYYLLLNDDTTLYKDAIHRLLSTHLGLCSERDVPIALVGSVRDSETAELTYGGWSANAWWNLLRTEIVNPSNEPVQCDTFNANCVLLDSEVASTVGNLDPAFTHGFGDFDYGFRVNKEGGEVWVAPGLYGECDRDPGGRPWFNPELSWRERIEALRDVKAEPLDERLTYARRHGGLFWVFPWLSPYIRVSLDCLLPGFFRPSPNPGRPENNSD